MFLEFEYIGNSCWVEDIFVIGETKYCLNNLINSNCCLMFLYPYIQVSPFVCEQVKVLLPNTLQTYIAPIA